MRMRIVAAFGVAAVVFGGGAANAQELKLEWGVEGYYRTRAVTLTNLAAEPRIEIEHPSPDIGTVVIPEIRNTSYITQRLRLSPHVKVGTIARLSMELNALDDVLYGDNNALNTAPLFSVNGTNQGFLGGSQQNSLTLSRAWVEFQIPVGVMRIGRMPSHWGMGILANGGGSGNADPLAPVDEPRKVADYYFDDDFGDNHFGSTNDRILFATKPLTVFRTLRNSKLEKQGKPFNPDTSSNLVVAYAFDKLSEAPHLLGDEDRRFRPFGQQGFISRGDPDDDANEHVFVLAYSNPDWDQVAITDELKIGTYQVIRTQDRAFTEPSRGAPHTRNSDGECVTADDDMDAIPENECVTSDEGSFVWIGDLWARVRYGTWYGEGEVVMIKGKTTGGVPFPSANKRKEANISAGALRGGYMSEAYDGILELGFASGDEDLTDVEFKQRPTHADYNVGLILFEEVLRERSARTFGPSFFSEANLDGARGLFSNGGVVNAQYIQPKVRWRPAFGGIELVGGVLFAWLDEWATNPPGLFPCPVTKINQQDDCTLSNYLGTEIDLAAKARFAGGKMDVSLETGYLFFGDALKVRSGSGVELDDAPTGAFTFQARAAFVF